MSEYNKCKVCGKLHGTDFYRDNETMLPEYLCLDCHGELKQIDKYHFVCSKCGLKHSFSFYIFTRSKK